MIAMLSASHWHLRNPNGFGIYVSISVFQMNGELNGLHVCHEAKMQAGWSKQVVHNEENVSKLFVPQLFS